MHHVVSMIACTNMHNNCVRHSISKCGETLVSNNVTMYHLRYCAALIHIHTCTTSLPPSTFLPLSILPPPPYPCSWATRQPASCWQICVYYRLTPERIQRVSRAEH